MEKKDQLIKIFSRTIRDILSKSSVNFEAVQEIRLRVRMPLILIVDNQEYYMTKEGDLSVRREDAHIVGREEIKETIEHISCHSLYAFEEELKQGFLTIQGGHRIGIAGRTVLDDSGIRTIKYISFLNVRLAHQVLGCADRIMPYLYENGQVLHTLIISPPRCGKTTLLRDIIRQFSDGNGGKKGVTVGVVDERSEIGACYQGEPQNHMGIRTDILDCCPKAKGMMMMIRTMSPAVIAVDEIGSREDLEAMEYVMNCGNSVEDIRQKPILRKLVLERMFERYIVLDNCGNVGHVGGVFDSGGSSLYYEGIHSKPPCARRAGCTTTHESQAGALGIPEFMPPKQ